jgi:DNA-binding IclR family transcriptional regulator
MIDIMRTVHGAYAPVSVPFGTRLETFFVGLCVGIGDIDGKPFSVAKIAAYMHVPRTTVIRRLDQLQRWGLIERQGRHYHLHEKTLNSLIGMRSYQQVRRILCKATEELTVLDTLAFDHPPLVTMLNQVSDRRHRVEHAGGNRRGASHHGSRDTRR